MARLPELCEAFAAVDDRDLPAIKNIARVVREAELISTTKRGVGASEMTVRDAANLMMALEGSEAAKDAVAAIERLRSLRARPIDKLYNTYVEKAPYAAICKAATFGEALEATIDAVPALLAELAAAVAEEGGTSGHIFFRAFLKGGALPLDQLLVTFARTTATIERIEVRQGTGKVTRFRMLFVIPAIGHSTRKTGAVDRAVSVRIGMPTLISIWKAIHGDEAYQTACSAALGAFSSMEVAD